MSSPVVTVHSKATFVEAVQNMVLNGIGNLVVMDGKKVAGIITERELLRHLVLNKSIPNRQVKYFLTEKFIKLDPGTSILSAAKSMIEKKQRLLVFHKASTGVSQLAGIITASDIIRGFLETDRNPGLEGAMTNRIFTLRPGNTILAASKRACYI
jgi:CBS domain-containing protein